MKELLRKSWWALALNGAAALLFGILAVIWPASTLLVLIALFAAYALVGGIATLIAAYKNRNTDSKWWLFLLMGLVSVAAGVIAVFNPDLTALALVLVMGADALLIGILEVAIAIRLRKTIQGEWLLIVLGVISIIFGLLVMAFPGAGALAMVWLVSFFALVYGFLMLMLAFRARNWATATPMAGPHPQPEYKS